MKLCYPRNWNASNSINILLIKAFIIFFLPAQIHSQNELKVIAGWPYFKNAPDALYNHLSFQAYEQLKHRSIAIEKLKTLNDCQERQVKIRETLLGIVGPFPGKTPLNAQIMRTLKKEGFNVEHIVFESRPGFKVTSSLFIPAGLKRNEKAAAIIFCSGHSDLGYRSGAYQHTILNLVKKGFIVFAYDPIGQGERLQYCDPETGRSVIGGPTKEHSYPGAQLFITGSSLASYMIWDGIRAVDFLLTRKEVDPARIGITGRSGGGTQSAYIAAIDDRIYAAAPECYITNFTRLLQSRGPQDAEQNFYHGISRGIDHPDFLVVRAPRPALLITTANDIFNIQGARETAEELSRVYQIFGKSENFAVTEDIAGHASTRKNSEAMYAFFQKHLNNPGSHLDEEIMTLTDEEIRVTATGQLSTSIGSETVFSLNRIESGGLHKKLQKARAELSTYLPQVIISAQKLSGYKEPGEPAKPVLTGILKKNGFLIEKYFIMGEGEYPVPYLLFIPDKINTHALIYLHPSGKEADSSGIAEIHHFVENGFIVLAPDLPGTGETFPVDFRGDAYLNGVSYNLWFTSILIGRSIVGIRAGDVNRLTGILNTDTRIKEIYALARGNMSPVLLHAAAFNPLINRVALINPLSSYRSIVMNRFYSSDFIHNSVPWALQAYDLPDLAACLAPRKLLMINVTDGTGKTMDQESIREDLAVIKAAYVMNNSESQLKISESDPGKPVDEIYHEWYEND